MFDLTVMQLMNAREVVQHNLHRESPQIRVQVNDVGVMLQCQSRISGTNPVDELDRWMKRGGESRKVAVTQ